MFQILRLQRLVFDRYRSSARVPLKDTVELNLRVLPDDLDLNFHMNNSRYLKIMDLGRWQFILRVGLLSVCVRRRWRVIAGAIDITYLRSLKLFQHFTLSTRLECWDHKWLIIEQRFTVHGRLHARARVRMLLLDRKGVPVPIPKIFEALQLEPTASPEPSERTKAWLNSLAFRDNL